MFSDRYSVDEMNATWVPENPIRHNPSIKPMEYSLEEILPEYCEQNGDHLWVIGDPEYGKSKKSCFLF